MGTAVERASAVSQITQKAEGYGMPHQRVDGMDLIAVHEAAVKAIELVRAGSGPMMLEAMTYRFRGHSMGDPERYRKQEEVKKWEENDPIGIYRKYLTSTKKAAARLLDEIDERAMQAAVKAVEFGEASPEPAPEALFENVYAEEV
jgi:pyruvate dehydrogenase E1 component alpha subunit